MKKQRTKIFLILTAFIVCFSFLDGCGKEPSTASPPSSASVRATNQTKGIQSNAPATSATAPLPAKPASVLTEMQEDAIALNLAVQSSRSVVQTRGFTLAPDLIARLQKYNPSPKADEQSRQVKWSNDNDGSVFYSFDEKSVWTITFRGSITAEIKYIKGKVGIKKGEVFIDEGTRIEVDGKKYIFKNGIWQSNQ